MKFFNLQPLCSNLLVVASLCCALNNQSAFAQDAPEPAVPIVSLTFNGSRHATAFPGTPVLLKVAILNSTAAEEATLPLLLATDAASWSRALRIDITGPTGASQSWPLSAVYNPGAEVTITDGYVELAWWLAPADSALLSLGAYKAAATLDTHAVQRAGAWKGLTTSVPATLTLQSPPPVLSEIQTEVKFLASAQYAYQLGDKVGALNFLNQALAAYPANVGALTLKSAILLKAGQTDEARAAADAAIDAVFAMNPNPPEPPLLLMEIQGRLEPSIENLLIRSIRVVASTLTLEWDSTIGESYQVEQSQDLQSWEHASPSMNATAPTSSFTTTVTNGKTFYRVIKH